MSLALEIPHKCVHWHRGMVLCDKGECAYCRCEVLAKELAAVTAQRDSLRKDAERYRWLRDSSLGQWQHPIVVGQREMWGKVNYIGPLVDETLDKAIDAATREAALQALAEEGQARGDWDSATGSKT